MPLYAYTCRHCQAQQEAQRRIEQRDRAAFCAHCARWSSRRVLTPPVLRGETVARS